MTKCQQPLVYSRHPARSSTIDQLSYQCKQLMLILIAIRTTNANMPFCNLTVNFKLRQALLAVITAISFIFFCFLPEYARASGLEKLMNHASPGSFVNVNKGAVLQDQKAGYLTGGSIIMRGPKPKELQPLMLQTPRFAFDACSGSFDARFGGLSYITAHEFSSFLKSVATSTGAYALKMAIKSACPQCEDIMSYLESVARDINGMTLNQCSMAQSIASGTLSALSSSSKQKCMMQSNMLSSSSDLFDATQKCTDDPDTFGGTGEDDELKALLGDEFNLVWKALSQGSSSSNSETNNLKELMMSISGSVIGIKQDGAYHFQNLASLVLSEDLIEQYIGAPGFGGSNIKLYSCNEHHKCLDASVIEVNLKSDETLYGNVSSLLESMVDKIYENAGELTDEEAALVEFSSIPLISLIEMELATKNKSSAASFVGMSEFVEVVCYDVITNYMQQMLQKCKSAVELLEHAQLDNVAIDKFASNVEIVRSFLRDKRFESFKKLQVITQVKHRIAQQQSVFELGFTRFMQSRNIR